MAWARLDDNFPDHPKVLPLSDNAFRVHVTAMCYAQRVNTRGVVSREALSLVRAKAKVVDELELAGLWEAHPLGWEIHDFLLYNPARESDVPDPLRRARAEAGRRGGLRSGERRRSKPEANGQANWEAKTKQVASNGEAKTKQVASKQTKPHPIPSHEEAVASSGDTTPIRVRELRDEWVARMPGKFQTDATVFDDFELLAEDYQGDPDVVREAIADIKRSGDIPWPAQIRKRLPPLPGKVLQHPAVGASEIPTVVHMPTFDALGPPPGRV